MKPLKPLTVLSLLLAILPAFAATLRPAPAPPKESAASATRKPLVYARVIGEDNKLTAAIVVRSVNHTDAEWKSLLTPEQYRITRARGTERAFTGALLDNHAAGVYACIDCGLPLFAS